MEPLLGIPTFFGSLVVIQIFVYIIQRFVRHKTTPTSLIGILGYMFNWGIALFWPMMEIPRLIKRKKWLEKAGLKEGHVYLEEGFGFGTSPIVAARMVGKTGTVYALDIALVNVVALWIRAKIRMLKNLKIILADASDTGLLDASVDTVFLCDSFHEFGNKDRALREIYRVLKPGGTLSIWDETKGKANKNIKIVSSLNLFSLEEQDKAFIKFRKPAVK